MEEFRPTDQLFDADPRQTCYAVLDEGGLRPRTLDDHYAIIAPLVLSDAAPHEVRESFDAARSLLAMAWCNVRLTQDAERRAYATVEMALRRKLAPHFAARPTSRQRHGRSKGKNPWQRQGRPTLQPLLALAVRQRLLVDEGFRQYHRIRQRSEEYAAIMREVHGAFELPPRHPQQYTCGIAAAIPELRNSLAHGSTTMHPWGHLTLEICCDIINQLYPS